MLIELLRRFVKWQIFFVLCRADLSRYYRARAGVVRFLARAGLYEKRNLALIKRHLKSGDWAVDVGANFGVYSLALAECVGSSGCVWAFEPLEPVFSELAAATRPLPHVRPVMAAVSERDVDGLEFNIPMLFGKVPEPALASLENLKNWSCKTLTVHAVSLDRFFAKNPPPPGTRITFIKIDVEGHELGCLQGAVKLLEVHKPVVQFEENNPEKNLEQFRQFADAHGYVLMRLDASRNFVPISSFTIPASGKREFNFYLVPV